MLAPHYSSMSIGEYLGRAGAAADAAGVPFAGIESWATEPAYVDVPRRRGAPRAGHDAGGHQGRVHRPLAARSASSPTGDPYPDELRATAEAVAAAVGLAPWSQWSVAWQSAGRTPEPWIGPDILAVIDDLAAAEHADGLLVCPCGFVADHLEVLYDLDIEARRRAEERGLAFRRTASMNADPAVIGALADRVVAGR